MANLITEKQKKDIRMDYILRLCSVSLFVGALLGIFFLAYVLPYSISVGKKEIKVNDLFGQILNAENKENTGERVSKIILQTTEQIKAVELYSAKPNLPSISFDKVLSSKNQGIRITKLSFSIIGSGQEQIIVNGIAKDREGLVSFIEDLKVKAGFADVETPVSDFAKDKDISFVLNIKTNL